MIMPEEFPEPVPLSRRTLLAGAGALGITMVSGCSADALVRNSGAGADAAEWSGGLNRHRFWDERGGGPRLHYIALKNVPAHDGHMGDAHYRRLRLIFASAMFTGAAIAQSRFKAVKSGSEAEPGREAFDELLMGKALRRNWLGRPLAPAVHLAERARDLLRGAGTTWPEALLDRFGGTGARFERVSVPGGAPALRVSFAPSGGDGPVSPGTGVPVRRFHLDGIHLRGAPLFVRFPKHLKAEHRLPQRIRTFGDVNMRQVRAGEMDAQHPGTPEFPPNPGRGDYAPVPRHPSRRPGEFPGKTR